MAQTCASPRVIDIWRRLRRSPAFRQILQFAARLLHPVYMYLWWWPSATLVRKLLPPANRSGANNRLLIIRDDGIGDLVMYSGVLKHLRYKVTGKIIYMLVRDGNECLVEPHVDHVVTFNPVKYKKDVRYRWKLLSALRRIGFGTAVLGVLNRSLINTDILQSVDAIEIKAYEGEGVYLASNNSIRAAGTLPRNALIPSMDKVETGKQGVVNRAIDHEVHFFEQLFSQRIVDLTPWNIRQADETAIASKVLAKFGLRDGTFFTIGLGASAEGRRWPIARFRELAEWVAEQTGLVPVAIGELSERALGQTLVTDRADWKNTVGELSLGETLALLRRAAFFVGNESGPMHLSAALGVPVAAVFGGGHFGRCIPVASDVETIYHRMDCFGCGWNCRYRNLSIYTAPCVEQITVDDVKDALKSTWRRASIPVIAPDVRVSE